jgi:hypothetical protein
MSDLEDSPGAPERRRKLRRRAIWVLVAVLLLVALILTPPLLNVNRLLRRITVSMSNSLGRPVHIDSVTLNMLPVPGFTLQNLVVSEDPAFGSEPVIRANSVRATVRASSLWRRQVEFATIRFDEPSVNLVRRADGRWNIESILLHAAQEDTAPTAQKKPSAAPRFPYIEATGARLNVKMGNEKMPLALTDADFALWLPSPQQWRVRLEAKPSRTDSNVSDAGELSIEATLQKAIRVEDVPIELTAAWRSAPLGEATRMLMGGDAGWRGTVDATATLRGTLGDAALTGNVKVSNLRRAEFVPAKTLDVNMECAGRLAVTLAVLHEPTCTLSPSPISRLRFGAAEETPASAVYVTSDKVELTGMKATGLRVGTPGVQLEWLMDFARLWSQRTPAEETPKGKASGSFVRIADRDGTQYGWQGELHGTLRARSLDNTTADATADRSFSVTSTKDGFKLAPFNLTFAEKTPLLLSATADPSSVSLQLTGTGTPHQITFLSWAMPPLADGFEAIPQLSASATAPIKIDLNCTRPWGGAQTCATTQDVTRKPKNKRKH